MEQTIQKYFSSREEIFLFAKRIFSPREEKDVSSRREFLLRSYNRENCHVDYYLRHYTTVESKAQKTARRQKCNCIEQYVEPLLSRDPLINLVNTNAYKWLCQ